MFQVRQETAMILMKQGIRCDHRATLPIKGKGLMGVYVVSEAANTYQRLDSQTMQTIEIGRPSR